MLAGLFICTIKSERNKGKDIGRIRGQLNRSLDFAVTGPVFWRGGFNAGKLNTTNNLYPDTECGINRVHIRSTLTPGVITATASRQGLTSATIKAESKKVNIVNGLMDDLPQTLPGAVNILK